MAWDVGPAPGVSERAGGWDFDALAEMVPEETPRWRELAALAKRVAAIWREWGFADVVAERWRLAADPVLPPGVDEIVVVGVPDPAPLGVLSWQALRQRGVPVTVLIGAPGELRAAFDAWGRPVADHWTERARHRRPDAFRLAVAADAAARAKVKIYKQRQQLHFASLYLERHLIFA